MRIRLEEFPGRVANQHRVMMQRLAYGIYNRLQTAMPVDTGWARFHLVMSYENRDNTRPGNPPADAQRDQYPPRDPPSSQPPLYPRIFIQNRVPYIEDLNRGTSTQAPPNFWETAVDIEFAVLRSGNRRGP